MKIKSKNIISLKKKYLRKRRSKTRHKTKSFALFSKILFLIFILSEIKFDISLYKLIINKFGKKSTTKVCLCLIIKKENLYLKFFVEHYRHLGYDHIYLYDNNDINDERVEDVIKKYINNGFITVIDYRGFKGPKSNTQMVAYYDCYEKYNNEYDWLSFFDIDEYLILKPKGIRIQNFLDNERYKDCPNIKINWLYYSDNNKIKYEEKPLTRRFTEVSKWKIDNRHIKSIMRGNISFKKYKKTKIPHYLYYKLKSCSSSGKLDEGTYFIEPPDYEYAILNHYILTITEFVNKMKRGRADMKFIYNQEFLKSYFDRYFNICDKTEEKVKIFNKAFNTSFK